MARANQQMLPTPLRSEADSQRSAEKGSVKSGQQYGDSGCALFPWAARRLCGLTLRELGVAAGAGKGGAASMSVSAVSKTIRRLEQRALRDKSLRTHQSRILEISNVRP
jgi:hypothetical protein